MFTVDVKQQINRSKTLIKKRKQSPVGIWCHNDVVSTSSVTSTLARRHFYVMFQLGGDTSQGLLAHRNLTLFYLEQSRSFSGEYHDYLLFYNSRAKLFNQKLPNVNVFWLSKDDCAENSARKRRKGRQTKRWEDNIKEYTGMD